MPGEFKEETPAEIKEDAPGKKSFSEIVAAFYGEGTLAATILSALHNWEERERETLGARQKRLEQIKEQQELRKEIGYDRGMELTPEETRAAKALFFLTDRLGAVVPEIGEVLERLAKEGPRRTWQDFDSRYNFIQGILAQVREAGKYLD